MLIRPILLIIAGASMPAGMPWKVGIIIIGITLFFS
jgi:hypothetical protein